MVTKFSSFLVLFFSILGIITSIGITIDINSNDNKAYSQSVPPPGSVGNGFVGGHKTLTANGNSNLLYGDAQTMSGNAKGGDDSIIATGSSNNKSFAPELAYASLIIKDSNDLQQTTKNYYSDINHSYDYYSGGLGDWISLIFSFTSNLSIILFFLFLSLSTVFYYIYRFITIKKELRSGIPPKRKGLLGLLDTPTIQQLSPEITTPHKNIPGTDLLSNLDEDILLTSVPTATEIGPTPTGTVGGSAGVNVPSPSPKSMETVSESLLAVARSKFPSLSKSPTTTRIGLSPTGTVGGSAGVKVPSPSPKSIEMLLELSLAVARSNTSSPSKSPTATESGLAPTGTGDSAASVNVPSPSPKNMETLPTKPPLATARSKSPSPLKSPTTTDRGLFPTVTSGVAGSNVPSPFPKCCTCIDR